MSTDTLPIGASATVRDIIVRHPFFKNLPAEHLPRLAECASLERFGPGQYIFREGQTADRFYLIAKGRVGLETFVPRCGPTTVQNIEAGGALGWSWLYQPHQWQFSARAIEPIEAVAFNAVVLRERADANHDFGYDLLGRVGQAMLATLQNTRRKLIEFYVRDLID